MNYRMDFIENANDREMLENAVLTINQLELWDWLRKFDNDSFMYSSDPNIQRTIRKMEENGYSGHSGSSFGCTMRNLQYIAKHGYDNWKQMFSR